MAEWIVEFKVFGKFSGRVAARRVNIDGARTWDEGDPILPDARLKHSRGGFSLASALPSGSTLAEHLDALLPRLPTPDALQELHPAPDQIDVSCALYLAPGERPEILFRLDHLQRIAALGAGVDVDLYPDYLDGEAEDASLDHPR